MWIAPALLGRAIRTATDGRRRATISQSFVLHLSVAAVDPDHLVLEGEMATAAGQRVCGVVKSTRQDLALLTPTFDTSTCFVDGNSFTFAGEALFESPDLLVEILSDVKSSGCEEVTLTLSSSNLQLSGKASDNCSRLQVSLRGCTGTGALYLHAPESTISAHFKARHLQRLSHLCGNSTRVLLQVGEEAPLSAAFELRGGGTCQIFIAPCLECGEDDHQQQQEQHRRACKTAAPERAVEAVMVTAITNMKRGPGKLSIARPASAGFGDAGQAKRGGSGSCSRVAEPYGDAGDRLDSFVQL
ncbi:hypothetical protein VaNZ11_009080 [Volvox africanus]|uniref:Uncharacterized protein n=1 Tax=Volvox africanus TaxID=51714 RepID=A0ABQ5S7I9_9CHLO|nr:hypothetical protein VaNZ11_009080 [Volvox africanus]